MSINAIGRIAKSAGKLIFMDPTFTETAEKALKASKKAQGWKNIHKQIRDAFVKAERKTAGEPFWEDLWNKQILGFPKDLKTAWGASKGLWGTTKAVGGQLLKRLPLLFVALEIPNIYSAFKDEGIVGGCTEILKSGTRFAASMAGFMAGQALIPIPLLGGLIGAIGTDWIVSKIIGKSHTEKKEEEKAKIAEAQQYQQQLGQMEQTPQTSQDLANQQLSLQQMNIPRATMTPQQMMQIGQMLYGGGMTNPMDQDFMAMSSGINNLGRNLNYYG